jgi:hypothetical protein
VNLRFIFDYIFSVERGCGYPPHRKESQRASKQILEKINQDTHRSFPEIIRVLPEAVIKPVLDYPGVEELIGVGSIDDIQLKSAFQLRMSGPMND